jgi:hypothetical protein
MIPASESSEVQQLLKRREPIYAPILREDVLASGAAFRVPAGMLGIECEFAFVMQRDFSAPDETAEIAAVRSAVAECFVAERHDLATLPARAVVDGAMISGGTGGLVLGHR